MGFHQQSSKDSAVKRSPEQQAQHQIFLAWRLVVIEAEQRLSSNASCLGTGDYHGRTAPVNPGMQVQAYQSMHRAWRLMARHPQPEARGDGKMKCLKQLASYSALSSMGAPDQSLSFHLQRTDPVQT
jgi:hypothetical protein